MAPSYKDCTGIGTTPFPYQSKEPNCGRDSALCLNGFLDLRLRQRRPSPNVHPRGKSRGISLQISAHFFEPDNDARESRTLEGHDMHREAVVIFTVTSEGPLTQGEDLVLFSA
jgi:hypothetical protein